MKERVGAWLRQAREAKGSTLEEAEDATRIRLRFLEALEAGNFAVLPSGEVQIRGFLRIYACYLDLPPDDVLSRYDAEARGGDSIPATPSSKPRVVKSSSPPPTPAAITPFSPPRPSRLPQWPALVIGLLLIVSVVGAGWYFFVGLRPASDTSSVASTSGSGVGVFPTVTSPATAETMTVATATLPSPSADVTVTPTFSTNPDGRITLTLAATEHVWSSVAVDGETVFKGMMTTNETKTWTGEQAVTVETGNGAGLLVTVNNQPQGAMCGRGEVCTRSWRAEGEVSPP